jgi:hypothetical protein
MNEDDEEEEEEGWHNFVDNYTGVSIKVSLCVQPIYIH